MSCLFILLFNSYFLLSSLFQSCFFLVFRVYIRCFLSMSGESLPICSDLNCQLKALRWGLWIMVSQGEMARQFTERNPGVPIFPLKLVRFPRYDSFKLLPGKMYALLPILRIAQKKAKYVSIFSLPNPIETASFYVNFLSSGLWNYTKCAHLNSKPPQYQVKRFEFFTGFELQTKTNFSDVSFSQWAEFHLSDLVLQSFKCYTSFWSNSPQHTELKSNLFLYQNQNPSPYQRLNHTPTPLSPFFKFHWITSYTYCSGF